MSRIGRMSINIPEGVVVTVAENNHVTVVGPKGTLRSSLHSDMIIKINEKIITVERPDDHKLHKSLHGLTRSLLANMVFGVVNGFKKELEINGVGYRANLQGKDLNLILGYSHPVVMKPPEGLNVEVPQPNTIIVHGADKQAVGQFAADIRNKRPPEPYKGKGIKYLDEHIKRKIGKAGAKKK